ncbi:MAG: hypothetical protein ACLUHE_15755 [Christensenellales bacterium]
MTLPRSICCAHEEARPNCGCAWSESVIVAGDHEQRDDQQRHVEHHHRNDDADNQFTWTLEISCGMDWQIIWRMVSMSLV